MLTVTDAWTAAIGRSGCTPVVIVEIYDGTTTWAASSDVSAQFQYPASVVSVSSFSQEMDPFDRNVQTSEVTVRFLDDGWLRSLVVANRLRNKSVTILLGELSLAQADYAPLFKGVISSILPGEGFIDVLCKDAFSVTKDVRFAGAWTNVHPLTAIKMLLTAAKVPTGLIDSDSLEDALDTSISHYCVSAPRYSDKFAQLRFPGLDSKGGSESDIDCLTVVDALAQMLVGSVFASEEGKVRFARFSTSNTVRRSLTADDVTAFAQESASENICNEIHIEAGADSESPKAVYVAKDETSQANYAYPGQSVFVASRKLQWPLGGAHFEYGLITTTSATTITLRGGTIFGMTGSRGGYPAASQDADAKSSLSRPIYLRFEDEIIKYSSDIAFDDNTITHPPAYNDDGSLLSSNGNCVGKATLSGVYVARGQLGTTATEHPWIQTSAFGITWPPATDITMLVDWATVQLQRFANGCPIVTFRTPLIHHDLQVGDFITLTHDQFLWYGFESCTTALTWEIIRKEVTPVGDDIGIAWSVAYATQTSPPSISTAHGFAGRPSNSLADQLTRDSEALDRGAKYVALGLEVSDANGLNVRIQQGRAVVGGRNVNIDSSPEILLPASKDVYVGVDALTGAVMTTAVTIGDPAPDVGLREIRLAKVTTGATTITTILDKRNLTAITPQQLTSESWVGKRVLNGDFGTWTRAPNAPPDNWIMESGTWATDADVYDDDQWSGDKCLRLKNTAVITRLLSEGFMPVEPNVPYVMRAAMNSDSTTAGHTVGYGVFFYNKDKVLVGSSVTVEVAPSTGWRRISRYLGAVSVASGIKYARVSLSKAAQAFSVLYDNAELVAIPSSALAYRNGAQSIAVSATPTKVEFENTSYNYGTDYIGPSVYRFLADIPSRYRVFACVGLSTLQTGKRAQMYLYKNGTNVATLCSQTMGATGNCHLSGGTSVELVVDDYLEIFVVHDDTGSISLLTGASNTYFVVEQEIT